MYKRQAYSQSLIAGGGSGTGFVWTVAGLLADDFQGTSTKGARFTKADELKDEKGAHIAHDCELDEAKVRFFGDSISVVYGSEHYVGKDKSEPNGKGLPGLDRHVAEARGYVADHRLAR